jgi:hypothetical protein
MSAPGEQAVDRLRGHGGVPGGKDLAHVACGPAEALQAGQGDLDGLRLSVPEQHLDHRRAFVGTAGRQPVTRPGQQYGEDVGRPLRGVVHAAAARRRLTGHGSIV